MASISLAVKIVVAVHAVEEEDARLGVIVGGAHDLIPQVTGAHLAGDPQTVVALVEPPAFMSLFGSARCISSTSPSALDGLHERIGDADRDVEVGQVAVVLGVDEDFDIRMVAAQHAHLRHGGAGRFDGFARAVEHAHVGYGAGRARLRALDLRALRGGSTRSRSRRRRHGASFQRLRPARCRCRDGCRRASTMEIADRLHEAVDQGRGERRAGGGVDAASRDEAVFLRPQETPSHFARGLSLLVGGESALATRRRTSERYLAPLAYFSTSTSVEISCSGRGRMAGSSAMRSGRELLGVLTHRVLFGSCISMQKCG